MSLMEEISNDQRLQEAKQNLQKRFKHLQSYSSSLSSFTLQWNELELLVKSIQTSIENLQSKQNNPILDPQSSPNTTQSFSFNKQYDWFVNPRPELNQLCIDMDGKRLFLYLIEKQKERPRVSIPDEIASALLSSPDPAMLVLLGLEYFYPSEDVGIDLIDTRRTCVHLLNQLMKIYPLSICPEVREAAQRMAFLWKEKVSGIAANAENDYLETLGFLLLVGIYQLASEFNNDELFDLIENIARQKKASELCRMFGFIDKIPDFVERLIKKGKQLEAINYICEFELFDKFQVFPLLRRHLGDAKKAGKEICRNGNNSVESQTEAVDIEIAAIRAVIRCIENHKIECKYNSDNLGKRFTQLVWRKRDIRRNAAAYVSIDQPQQQQSGNKRRCLEAAGEASNNGVTDSSSVHSIQRRNWYSSDASAGQYGLEGNYTVGGGANLIPGQFELAGTDMGSVANAWGARFGRWNS